MGAIWNAAHLRMVAALGDMQSDGTAITLSTHDGKKRSSAQRDRDLMDGRYFVHSILRVVDREMYHGIRASISFDVNGFLDITAYNVVNHAAINLRETSAQYNDSVPVIAGDEVPLYKKLLATTKTNELVASIVNDNSASSNTVRLRLLKGGAISYALNTFVFDVGYYAVPLLTELTAAGGSEPTEPRVWYPLIEMYAIYLARLGSDTERSQIALQECVRLASNIVSMEYGAESATRVRDMLHKQYGEGNGG